MHGARARAGPAAAIVLAALLARTAPATAEAQDPPPPPPRAYFEDRLLTVAAEDAPLGAVLGAVGEAAAIDVPVIDTGETFTGALYALPLLDALDRLLGRRSYRLSYDPAGEPERLELIVWSAADAAAPEAPAPTRTAAERASPAQEEAWIAQRLTSPKRGDRIVAVRRLQRLPPDRAAALGMRFLQAEPDPVVRGQLAAALGRVEGEGGVDVLTRLLDDEDASVRIAGARALGRVAQDAAARGLGRTLLQGADPALRQAALDSLASHPQAAARDFLRTVAARNGDPLADAARQALSGERPVAESLDAPPPCLHAADPTDGCLKK